MEKYYYLDVDDEKLLELELSSIAHNEFNCTGIEEFSIDEPKVDEILGERSYSGADLPRSVIDEVDLVINTESSRRKFYFSNLEQTQAFALYLKETFLIQSSVVTRDEQDWNAEWKKSYKKIEIDDEMNIIPAWDKADSSGNKGDIFIYPGMGFGTGSHETTFLCLKSVQAHKARLNSSMRCLDFGCGSGILGIALNKAYQIPCDLYDIDVDALKNCEQNIELNDLSSTDFKLLLPSERNQLQEKYEIIFANILQNVLTAEANYITNSLLENGLLILSGLLKGQEDEIIALYLSLNSDLEHTQTYVKNDWVAVEFVLKP